MADAPDRKACPKCGHEGPIEEDFGYRTINGRRYAQSQCRKCRSGKGRETAVATKTCSDCRKDKPATLEHFPPSRFEKGGIRSQCRECKNKRVRAQRAAKKRRREERA